MRRGDLLKYLGSGGAHDTLAPVYGAGAEAAAGRLQELMMEFAGTFPCGEGSDTWLFSTPGRTELGGNHTDHQNGLGLAASVNLDTIACVVPNSTGVIRIKSRNHRPAEVTLDSLSLIPEETGSSPALVRGVAARLTELGHTIGGFDAYTTTRVLRGSGLSSSAAFEVLMGTIANHLFCGGAFSPVQVAQMGQYAENVYFGKPCGLMDQLSCSVGGVIAVDFANESEPAIRQVHTDLSSYGHALCIVDTRASHADLTADYAAIPQEMREVAACFGREVLGEVDPAVFRESIPLVRATCGDRAMLRAHHFFLDDALALRECDALARGDFDEFLRCVNRSGRSSYMYLQNVSNYRESRSQPVAVLLAVAEALLADRGACRVHGGGFAGTIQAFVPLDLLDAFVCGMEAVAGEGACHVLDLRGSGSVLLLQ